MLGYPVDNAGVVSDKTLAGANKLKLDSSYGDPAATTSVSMGVNLPAGEPVIASNVVFDATDPDTYSATAAVTIFDNAGNLSRRLFIISKLKTLQLKRQHTNMILSCL